MRVAPPAATRKMSECERQFAEMVEALNRTLEKLEKTLPAERDPLQDAIEQLVGYVNKLQSACADSDRNLSLNAQRSAFLLSRKTDISRQVAEARRFVDASGSSGASDILTTQPLDRDSETLKRQLSTQCIHVKKLITTLEERLTLLTGICSSDAHKARTNLLQALVKAFQKTKLFQEESIRIDRKVQEMAKKIPEQRAVDTLRSPMKSPFGRRRKPAKIAPLALSTGTPSRKKQTEISIADKKRQAAARWGAMERSLQSLKSQEITKLGVRELPLAIAAAPDSIQSRTTARSPAKSMLLPAANPAGFSSATPANPASVALFSPPSSLKTRSGWDKVSELDRAKQISLSLPAEVKETTFAAAAGEALAPYGTTPDKVRASLGVTKRGASPPKPRSSSSTSKPASSSEQKKAPSGAAFPPISSKAPSNPFGEPKKSDSSSFPPMSKLPPKPFSSVGEKNEAKAALGKAIPSSAGDSLKTPSMPSMSIKSALPAGLQGLTGKVDPSATSKPAFGMGGLGTSLFGGAGNNDIAKSPELSKTAPGFGSPPAANAAPEPNYTDILTEFYQKHNPAKVADVGKHLTKYKASIYFVFDACLAAHSTLTCFILFRLSTGKRKTDVCQVSRKVQNFESSRFSTIWNFISTSSNTIDRIRGYWSNDWRPITFWCTFSYGNAVRPTPSQLFWSIHATCGLITFRCNTL